MTAKEELNLFLLRADELIESKYILANIKIINLLKSIASSETLLAIFRSCLEGFDYETDKEKYFLDSSILGEGKGEFRPPENSKDFLALVFNVLMEIDVGRIDFNVFLSKYFYRGGSYYESYSEFIRRMIMPFRSAVKDLMTGVIKGKIGYPELDKAPDLAVPDDVVNEIYAYTKCDRDEIKKKWNRKKRSDGLFIIDMFEKVLASEDSDAIRYAWTAYRYTVPAITRKNQVRKIEKLLTGNGKKSGKNKK